MKTIFNKMYVADMYINVTQYDNMQRAFVGDSPQLRVMSSFCFEGFIILLFLLLTNGVCY